MRALAALAPVAAAAWIGVINDWLDNARFDAPHACAAVIVAYAHLEAIPSPPSYNRALLDLRREAHRVCRLGDPSRIRVGMSDMTVGAVAGLPRLLLTGGRCWLYTTRRICFVDGRVSTIQLVTHG